MTLTFVPILVAQVGHIQGGWPYVWAAYGITWTALALYSASLWWRHKS